MKRLVDGEMSSASPSLRFAVGIEVKASSNSTQPQPSAPPPDLQSSSPPLPPNATQSPPPPSEPPMASAPPNLSPPLEPTVSPPSPPSSPPPKSPPPLDDPPANSPPPPPVDPSHPLPPPVDPPHLPPPPSTNHPPPSPPVTKSPPAKPPESPLPPPSPPPPPRKSPPPPPRQSPPPPSISPLISPQPPSILKSPPPRTIWSPPSRPPSPRGTSSTDTSSVNGSKNSNSISDEGIGTGAIVILALVFGLLVLAIVGAACCRRGRKKFCGRNSGYIMPTSSHKSDPALRMSRHKNGSGSAMNIICPPLEPCGFGNSRSWFNYEELVQATNGFSAQNLLGEGGFGSVYKGVLADGRDVAVKQLKIGGGQGDREFRSEVEIISCIHHRHLVSLVGYCINENRRLLVYDYVLNNNLYFHLHGEGRPVLNWSLRVKISLGAARGIAYLHEDCHPRIIHRDIKSSNILLDSNFEARVSDFGLAKLALDANTHVSTRVMGTFGYMAPEYASSGKLTERSDVYSFGVVLLELITGRKPIDNSQPVEAENLVEWAQPLLSQAIETQDLRRLVDPRLESQYVDSEMLRMIEAAAACVRHSVIKRPKMRQVVRALDTMATTDLTNGMRVGESRAADSAEIRLFRRMAFGTQEDFSSGFFDS